jgi:hypothetical protein
MPSLLTPDQLTSAELLDATRSSLGLLATAAAAANRMVSILLNLDNAALEAWLNSQPMDDVFELFSAHKNSGDALNASLAIVAKLVTDSGLPANYAPVDTSPFQDKLAAQGRQANYNGIQWVVSALS